MCQDHEREKNKQTNKKPKDCLRLEKPKETWQLNAMWNPGLHPESGKKKKASIGKLEKFK